MRQESDRNQAQYQQETSVAKAQYQAEIDQAQQTAAQAGPLAQAKAQQDVLSEQAKVAQAQAELRRQQLVAEVVRPAEAEAEKVRTLARAQADAIRLQAEATATSGGVVLERMLVENMPEILAAAAGELRQANVTVLNGAEGLGELVAGLATPGQLDPRRRPPRQWERRPDAAGPPPAASAPLRHPAIRRSQTASRSCPGASHSSRPPKRSSQRSLPAALA